MYPAPRLIRVAGLVWDFHKLSASPPSRQVRRWCERRALKEPVFVKIKKKNEKIRIA